MNTIAHIVRKDLRLLAVPLGAWLAFIVGKAAALVAYAGGDLPWPGEWFGTALAYANWLEAAVGMVLATWFLFEDNPCDPRTFWMTRPISGRRLLAAKLSGATLALVALPILLLLPVWLAAGFGPREIALAAVSWAFLQGALTVLALTLATVSANASQMILGLVAFALLLAAGLWLEWKLPGNWTGLACVLALTAALVLGLQYLGRRRRAGVASLTVGLGLLALGFAPRTSRPEARPLDTTPSAALPVEAGSVQRATTGRWRLRALRPRRDDVSVSLRQLGFHSYLFDGLVRPSCVLHAGNDSAPAATTASMLGEAGAASLRVADLQASLPKEGLPGATWRLVYPAPEIPDGNASPSPTP